MSTFTRLTMLSAVLLTALLLVYHWPFSKVALLLPLMPLSMYLISIRMVRKPVIAAIYRAAESVGMTPVPAEKKG